MNPAPQALPLRDIHLPEPISWWPPAPGWWLLILLLLILGGAVWLAIYWRKRGRLKREAKAALLRIQSQYQQEKDERQLAQELSVLLRRIAISRYPKAEVAALTDREWLAFLDKGLSKGQASNGFTQGPGQALISAPYRPECDLDAQALLTLCQSWVNALPAGARS